MDGVKPNEIIYDDDKGDELDPAQVRADRRLETDRANRQKEFVKSATRTRPEAKARLHNMKWMNTKKRDIVRSRFVVREIKAQNKEHERLDPSVVFASMPPAEGREGCDIAHANRAGERQG